MRNKFALMLSAASTIPLTGCFLTTALESPKPTYSPVPAMCEVFKPIEWRYSKPVATEAELFMIRQIKPHNSVWLDLCAKLKPPQAAGPP